MSMRELSWKRFGYHVVYDADILNAIDYASCHGFGYIVPDLMIPRFFPERFDQSERRRIQQAAEAQNVAIAFHAPSDYLNLGTIYPKVRTAVINRMKRCLDFARDVDAERFTIHIAPPFDFALAGRKGTYLKDHWALYKSVLKQSLFELVDYSSGDVTICVENDRLSDMAMEVLKELLPTGNLFLTWDLPKSHTDTGKPITPIENFLLHYIESIRECHLHDQKPGKHSHDLLGVGSIKFPRYLRLLVPLEVHFTLEIRPRERALQSLKILKDMLGQLGWQISAPS